MVLAWLCGDLAKTAYFVATGSPIQFWVCAILQVSPKLSTFPQPLHTKCFVLILLLHLPEDDNAVLSA